MQFSLIALTLGAILAQSSIQPERETKSEGSPQTQAEPAGQEQPAPPRRRARPEQLRIPDEVQVARNVVYSTAESDEGQPIELMMDAAFLKESDGKPMPVIVYIHGGGWHSGTRQSGMQQAVAFALGGYFAVTIDYRLSGQAKFPAAVEDCKNAVRFLREHAEELGIDPERIGVWGHSAGGHLAGLLATSGNDANAFVEQGDEGANCSAAVKCAVSVSGPVDMLRDGAGGPIERWLGGPPAERADVAKRASPLTYIDASDPPILIVHGTDDKVVNIRHGEAFEKALADAGVETELLRVEGGGHAIAQPRAYVRIAEFFDEHLGGNASATVARLRRAGGNSEDAKTE